MAAFPLQSRLALQKILLFSKSFLKATIFRCKLFKSFTSKLLSTFMKGFLKTLLFFLRTTV